jgi:probable phosphoglycerate mutase
MRETHLLADKLQNCDRNVSCEEWKMSMRLYVIRHGETEWSRSGQHTGRSDIELTENGKAEARGIATRIKSVEFSSILVSPLKRAIETCELAGFKERAHTEADLIEWDNGDYEGRTAKDIRETRPGWNLFNDGCPNGESPGEVAVRVDRLINSLKAMHGNVALFTHGHLSRALAARWLDQPIEFAKYLLLDTASVSILCYHRDQHEQPAILLWNSSSVVLSDELPRQMPDVQTANPMTAQQSLEQWENEGGEIPVQRVALSALATGKMGKAK